MKILIGADIVPTEHNILAFQNKTMYEIIDKELIKILNEADFRILNLEVPLTDTFNPIDKVGVNLISNSKAINGIKELNIDFLTLANNHILDQGVVGLQSTIKLLMRNDIKYAGVGNNLESSSKPFILNFNGERIGIYCCCENEFSVATSTTFGANPFDPINSLDHINELRKNCDFLIVLYHGGKEFYQYPAPYLQKICRKMVEKGANLVVCQHSHCIGSFEKYMDSTIIYGQGNFLFDDGTKNKLWNESLLLEVNTKTNDIIYHPMVLNKHKLYLSIGDTKEKILSDFFNRSDKIKQSQFIEDEYNKCSDYFYFDYISKIQGDRYNSLFFRALNKLLNHRISKYIYQKNYSQLKSCLKLINVIECEAHRDCFLRGLKNNIISNKKVK